ncbi:hypothetical protein ACN27G_29115 [Plantactinospora sp. WMMB334]|uniref:hypothetical protein n=1 Tax=Plantactinospora sp. WMMB334 TaxID=3404119 RepID=UPI003B93239F
MLHPATRAAIPAVLTQLESAADQYGWDQPPVVFGLFDRPDIANDAGPGLGALELDTTLAAPDLWTEPDPARPDESLPAPVILQRFARQLATPPARVWLRDWLTRDRRALVGFGLVFEAWAGPVAPGYRRGDLANAPAALRREVRIAAAVDTDLGLHRVARVRHGQPSTARSWPELPRWSQRRGIVVGLRALTELAKRV